ncbi:ABC transporter permease [Acholeplasma hippikon]|uniref:Oligopeptide transport system permease protein oppC n=1 Tax=Acholeplasma hippikon TaxID=264636 RepID=A0A449BL24_9MOLU|nr:ABC transporter permease [Acholeplasma hippikon]VEU83168.1 Oligopeptide transport system permease protein oppC [Acholeplasma hippikon]
MDKRIDQSKFQFVDINEKIFDAKFEGKPRSFLKDAMVRFAKNKLNLIATTIVAMVIFLSIFVPILTPKDYSSANNANMRYLPPRVPLLEKIGILDGTIKVKSANVDFDNYVLINPAEDDVFENRLFYPKSDQFNNYDKNFIKSGSLVNFHEYGNNKTPEYLGGTNDIILNNRQAHIVMYNTNVSFAENTLVKVTLNSIAENGKLTIYIKPNNLTELLPEGMLETDPESLAYYVKLGEITEATEEAVELLVEDTVSGKLAIVFESPESRDRVSINSISFDFPEGKGQDIEFEGYTLSQWSSITMTGFGGTWIRNNAYTIKAAFTYYKYNDIFANRLATISNVEYEAILEKNPEMRDAIVYNDPADPKKGWKFEGGPFELVEVVSYTTPITGPDGQPYFSYRVLKNGLLASGYTETPFFLFGTDGKGRDLFAEVWLSLRTSLLLGVIVSVINIVIGIVWGSISGYFGGTIDFAMERFVEVLSAFPGLTVLTILYIEFGAGFGLLLIYLTYSGWIGVAGMTRIQFYRYRGREYVLASRTLGASDARLIFKHILPNGLGYIITSVILSVPSMILTEASLSYLGFGLGESSTLNFGLFKLSGLSLGIILYEGQNNMTTPGRFYLVLIPAIIIIIIMIAFNLFGNALRDAMNPSLRGQE